MMWYCGYRALPKVRAGDLARRLLRQHDAGTNRPADVRAWFTFPSGLAGFVLIEVGTSREVAAIVAPYAGLVEWDIQAVEDLNYNQTVEELRVFTSRAALGDLMSGESPADMLARARGPQ
ncbi:hypothetical protein [Actinocrispum wychmicini]|uniref:DUF3303 domain-containing protein n=1 Tax=Actinocrispum wychmicini TaxID=1213861 RepID=A0A4R2JSE5_9PSEU|nr:hypothetical protein [Actinocrispum wychmicini]TCO62017.1 hypothetical protein EV192_102154 [Actinocrispum wychmicini]